MAFPKPGGGVYLSWPGMRIDLNANIGRATNRQRFQPFIGAWPLLTSSTWEVQIIKAMSTTPIPATKDLHAEPYFGKQRKVNRKKAKNKHKS